ncbi:hypothetical protein Hypma_014269 [Hypsizygus marmoreus]|uniref:Uncharacterized protein n=1 Tax=Hypsizygus marmoreus TaxID=39966 RepID=A0A369JEW9_HYPMA|nr:hypothetical protein Hypma_014269 [Hypsizygus marmoreus]
MPDVGAEEYILIPEEEVDASRIPGGLEELNNTVKNASKGVKEDTDKQYKRLAKKCLAFLHEKRLLEPTANFFCENPPENAPLLIVAWIMHSCDEMNLDGTVKSQQEARETYTHAQKMRAAMTYVFGRIHGLGKTAWHKSELTGHMVGNPSVGEAVSSYMVSLRRRKVNLTHLYHGSAFPPPVSQVQAGETATSARAVAPVKHLTCFIHTDK